MVFHWGLSESESPQVSWTLLSIRTDLNNAVIWMVSTRPLILKSPSPYINPLVTVPRAPITISIIVTLIFHIFFQFQINEFILLFPFCYFYSVVSRNCNVHNSASSLFFFLLLIIIRSGRLAKIRWTVCMSKSQMSLWVTFSRTDSWLSIQHLFFWSNFNLLPNSQWITFPPSRVLSYFLSELLWIIIIIIITLLRIFHTALADRFSLESEWRQISSSPLDLS